MIRPAGKFPGTFPGHSSFMNCLAWYSTFDPLEELMSRRFVSNLIVALGVALPGRGRFNKFSYDAALVLPYPIQAGSATLSPYVLGGAGAISVHQLGASDTWTKFAGNFGAGLEYRFGRIGLRAEGRDFVYKFDRFGFDKTQHDIAWQGGLTLTF